jgi:choline kinase
LVVRQIAALRAAGIAPIHVVTGFARETFASLLGGDVREIYNDRWATTNNLVTLASAGPALDGGFLLFNSDVLFHPGILDALLACPHPCALVVDDRGTLGDEEMKVQLDGAGRLAFIAKTLDPRTSAGEYIGLAKFDAAGARILRAALAEMVAAGRTGEWYEGAFQAVAGSLAIRACSTHGLPWTEIDTPEDLARAEILARDHGL